MCGLDSRHVDVQYHNFAVAFLPHYIKSYDVLITVSNSATVLCNKRFLVTKVLLNENVWS